MGGEREVEKEADYNFVNSYHRQGQPAVDGSSLSTCILKIL